MNKWLIPFENLERYFDELPQLGRDLASDIYEDNGNIIVEMNIPGIAPDKIDINVHNNILRVSGEREEKEEKKEKHFYRKEIKCGFFERTFELPAEVDAEKTTAEFKHGYLKINLPKKKESSGKKINVKS